MATLRLTVQRVILDDVFVRLCHLVLFLIGLLDERTGDLMQLTESRNDPHCLRTALLRSLRRHTHTHTPDNDIH